MAISSYNSDVFEVFVNDEIEHLLPTCEYEGGTVGYSRYKLHLFFDPNHFSDKYDALMEILTDALQKKIITGFKVLNFDRYREKYVKDSALTASRASNLPFTIYLHNTYEAKNISQVLSLCKTVEDILKTIPAGNNKSLSTSDIVLSKHITFRQTALKKKEYLAADSQFAQQLKEAGRCSRHFIFLNKGMITPAQKNTVSTFYKKASSISRGEKKASVTSQWKTEYQAAFSDPKLQNRK